MCNNRSFYPIHQPQNLVQLSHLVVNPTDKSAGIQVSKQALSLSHFAKRESHNQKYHLGLSSSSLSVNSSYWYQSAPALPTGNGLRTNTSTGLGRQMAKCSSLEVSSKFILEVLTDLRIGSTVIHPRPEIATSPAGLSNQSTRKLYI